MKTLILLLLSFTSLSARSDEYIHIDSLTINRIGTNQLKTTITQNETGVFHITPESCNSKALTESQRTQNTIQLENAESQEMKTIFNNEATLTSDQSLVYPLINNGDAFEISFKVRYRDLMYKGTYSEDLIKIANPVVIMNSQSSNILLRIECSVRKKLVAICGRAPYSRKGMGERSTMPKCE